MSATEGTEPQAQEGHEALIASLKEALVEGGIAPSEVEAVTAGMVANLVALTLVLRGTEEVLGGQCCFVTKTGQTVGVVLNRRPGGMDIRIIRIAEKEAIEEGHEGYRN